jgi:hypothetical protein
MPALFVVQPARLVCLAAVVGVIGVIYFPAVQTHHRRHQAMGQGTKFLAKNAEDSGTAEQCARASM